MARDEHNFYRLIFVIVLLSMLMPNREAFSEEIKAPLNLRLETETVSPSKRDAIQKAAYADFDARAAKASPKAMITIRYGADGLQQSDASMEVWKPSENLAVDLYQPEDSVAGGVKLKYSM